ncbi:hypothetical protein ACGFT2_27885 [Streptomyces sp. NPDC048514]|uniref:hypothetical protein n=1 Tax=Streptomyces sp. NPDC048514 TaxID=3365564 RepID=UPI0037127B33
MMKALRGQVLQPVAERFHSTAGRSARLGPYTYLPAPSGADTSKGVLMMGGLPVPLEVTEEILQDFMDSMSFLERDTSKRWVGLGTWSCASPAE